MEVPGVEGTVSVTVAFPPVLNANPEVADLTVNPALPLVSDKIPVEDSTAALLSISVPVPPVVSEMLPLPALMLPYEILPPSTLDEAGAKVPPMRIPPSLETVLVVVTVWEHEVKITEPPMEPWVSIFRTVIPCPSNRTFPPVPKGELAFIAPRLIEPPLVTASTLPPVERAAPVEFVLI